MVVDTVNHPSHYTQGGVECIDAIEAALTEDEFRGYLKGNVIKYNWRSNLKGNLVSDLRKAQWYLNRLVRFVDGGDTEDGGTSTQVDR